MSSCNRITSFFVTIAVLAGGLGGPILAEEPGSDGDVIDRLLIVQETDWYADGTSVSRAPYAVGATPEGVYAPDMFRPAAAAATGISVRNTTHWLKSFSFKVTKYILDQKFRKLIKKSLADDVNKPRGKKRVPKQTVTKKKTIIKNIEDFANPNDFYFQKNFNSMNEIIMTEDDQFFRSPPPGLTLFDPDRIATTRRFAFATCVRRGGKFVCPFYNVEADVYLRSDFFDRATILQKMILAAVFRQTLGYNNTMWTNDLLGINNPYLTEATFNNRNSPVWKQVKERDCIFYPDGLPNKKRAAQAKMMPRPHTVIDFGGDLQPERFQTDLMSSRPTLILTNLHAAKTPLGPNSNMTVIISRVEETLDDQGNVINTKNVKITSLKGKTEDYPIALQGTNEAGFPTLFLSDVGFAATKGADKAIEKIRDAIDEHGVAMEIDGLNWSKVLKIVIQAKGRLTDVTGLASSARSQGKTKKIKQRYYAVNSDNEIVFAE